MLQRMRVIVEGYGGVRGRAFSLMPRNIKAELRQRPSARNGKRTENQKTPHACVRARACASHRPPRKRTLWHQEAFNAPLAPLVQAPFLAPRPLVVRRTRLDA